MQNKNKEISSKDQISTRDQSNSGPTTSEQNNKHTSISIKDSDSIRKAQEPQKLNIVISFIKDDEGIGQMVGTTNFITNLMVYGVKLVNLVT